MTSRFLTPGEIYGRDGRNFRVNFTSSS